MTQISSQWNWLVENWRSVGFVSLIIGMGFLSSHPICDGNDHIICDARGRCDEKNIFVVEPETIAAKDLEDLKRANEIVHEKGDIGACLDPKFGTRFLKKTKPDDKKFFAWVSSLYHRLLHRSTDPRGGTASFR